MTDLQWVAIGVVGALVGYLTWVQVQYIIRHRAGNCPECRQQRADDDEAVTVGMKCANCRAGGKW